MGKTIVDSREDYLTIRSSKGPYEFKEKGSRFISFIHPVSDSSKAEVIIGDYKKKYYDSTHVCFGYRIGDGEEKHIRYSDDGEPSGTAGLPIINEIKGKELFNVLVIVIRYYGGTKLGTGGLGRAYRDSAKLSVQDASIVKTIIKRSQKIIIPYNFMSELMKVVKKFSMEILDKKYDNNGIEVDLSIPVKNYKKVRDTLINLSKGKIEF
ncbi:MAG: YigZ family protein [Candidatus Aminicenantes bacterium]|nr:YigZ family protein [Candidatus Aminicenantes bacterium]